MTDTVLRRALILALLFHLAFWLVPGIDLWVTALFYDGAGFAVAHSVWGQGVRMLLWRASVVVPVALLIWLAAVLLADRRGSMHRARRIGVQVLYLILGPGLIVNAGLKAHWGRARPLDVVEFGGLARFTPPMEVAQECARNCSFVSGEVAMAVASALVVHRLALPLLRGRGAMVLAVGLGLACLVSAYLRVAAGRHFLSDAVFAALLMVILHRAVMMLDARQAQARVRRPVLAEAFADFRAATHMIAGFVRVALGPVPEAIVLPLAVRRAAKERSLAETTDQD